MSPLWVAAWLAVILVAAKALLLGPPRSWPWFSDLARVSFRDVLFAALMGMAGQIAVWSAARRPGPGGAVRRVYVGFAVLCAFYSVIAVGVFDYFGRPLSYSLLRLIGNVGAVRSSITDQITLPVGLALIGMPASLLALALWSGRRSRAGVSMLAAVSFWVAGGWWQHHKRTKGEPPAHLELNPHVELVHSAIVGLIGADKPVFPKDFPPTDVEEFRTFGARGRGPRRGFEPPPGVARPRNVIVIVLESVGTKYSNLYGSRYDTMPNLSAEAANALVFDNFYSHASFTYPSFRPINFAVYPGLPWCYMPWGGRPLPPPLALAFRQRGGRTAYMTSGDLDWEAQRWLLLESHSFDATLGYNELGCPPLTSWGAEDRCLIDRLIQWIDQKPDKPFFAVCWTDQTHHPYRPSPGMAPVDFFHDKPPAALAEDLSRYLNVLHETDRQLGRLFAALRQRNLADDTLVVVTGDHGEAFSDPHDQRGHSLTIYQEEVHVPLMLWNPRLFAPGRRVATIGGHVDLNPTIADVLGIEPLDAWQGYSLFDPKRPPRAFFMTSIGDYLFGVCEDRWKYIFDASGGREMLFDLERDPDEQHNVAPAQPDRCRRLRQRTAAWVSFEDQFVHGRAN